MTCSKTGASLHQGCAGQTRRSRRPLKPSFVARGQRLDLLQAVEGLHQFDDDMKTAQILLYGRNSDSRQLDEGLTLARTTLGRYQVLENSAWREQPAVRHLTPEDRD